MDDTNRNSKSKADVKKLILKHFNSSWAGMMIALIILDGEFDYDFENDSWIDASYEFDSKALYKILNEKGYFDGAYGDPLPYSDITSGSGIDAQRKASYEEEGVEPYESVDAYTEVVEETPVYDDRSYSSSINIPTLTDLAENLDPRYFTYELKTYRMGSDKKMEQTYYQTGSTNVTIVGSGMISNHNIELFGWITEDGTIHGRYHNENGINLDFNGYIRPDNSLYIQLGHDSEKSDWYLYPAASEMPDGYARYEGKGGKSHKDSYVVFSES